MPEVVARNRSTLMRPRSISVDLRPSAVSEPLSLCPPCLRGTLLALVASLLAITGCSLSTAPPFELNREGRDPAGIPAEQVTAVQQSLQKLFGTPDSPALPAGVTLDWNLLKAAAGPIRGEADGRQWGLYRRHCAGCHGISGDGAGPAAVVLAPYPRDYRNGVFKYTSTAPGAKPVRTDLVRTIQHGIPGTAMPSFRRLPTEEQAAVVEYVQYLSLRGETELQLLQAIVDEEADLQDVDEIARESVLRAAKAWQNAQTSLPVDGATTAESDAALKKSVERGQRLFVSPAVPCARCHGLAGNGRGEQSELYDDWNKRKLGATPEQTRQLAGRFKLPIEQLHPRDFTKGLFHGGDRPEEQYLRIYNGIKGTPMPAFGQSPGNPGVLTPQQIRDLVQYVRSLGPVGRL